MTHQESNVDLEDLLKQ